MDLTINDGEDDAHHHLSSDDEVDYSINSDPITLLANAHKRREMSANRVLMHRDQWTGVSPEGQKIWDQLSEEDKAMILKKAPISNSMKPSRSSIRRKPNSCKVNIHENSVYDFIMANAHQLDHGEQDANAEDDAPDAEAARSPEDEAQMLHAFLASHGNDASPADLRNVLSTSSKRVADKPCQANTHLTYSVGKHQADKPGALIDHGVNGGVVGANGGVVGANGGVAGADVCVIEMTHRAVNVQGVSDHQVTDLKIVTAGGVVQTQHGPVITIFHQYAHLGTGKTIYSSIQLEEFGLQVDEKPVRVPGGLQCIKTPDGYVHPIRIKDGLPYISLRPYTNTEWETLPHVVWTRDSDWDPTIFDHDVDEGGEEWYDAMMDHAENPHRELFDEFGNYRKRQAIIVEEHYVDAVLDEGLVVDRCVRYVNQADLNERQAQPKARRVKPGERDWETLRRFFGWASINLVEKTFQVTT